MPDTSITAATGVNSDSRLDLRTLLLAQKTEVIGELTRAIGNQFNNTMMGITSYSELVLKKLPPAERRNLEQVLRSAGIATGLVQKLLSISRNMPASRQSVDLNSLIVGIVPLLEQLAGEQVAVTYDLESNLPAISAEPAQLEQVALSLAINARNAMSKGGTLTLQTKLTSLTKDTLGESERPGEYVMFSVDDTGTARSTEISEASSLNDQDARMNLSLAAVRAVARNSEGIVRFSSDPTNGSSFKIYFPAQSTLSARNERSAPRNLPVASTILIVEDDDAVRVPTAELLKMEGFKVLQARTGAEAIRVVEQNRSSLDILVTDVLMPRMTGQEVAETLLQMNPDLKVLFMSGEDVQGFTPGAARAVLRKPFRLDALKDKIHELLGQ
jgi:two-component system cell cycle sensor histidine kinase/response regulator CckA